jgi:WD40 repeat protein
VTAGVVSGDGRLLVTTSTDGTARVWALPSGVLVTDLIGHTNQVTGAAFSSDGASVVTWSLDGTARVWDARRGATRAVLAGSADAVTSGSFDSSGDLVLTTSADGRARLWKSHVDAELRRLTSVPTPVATASFSDDGDIVAAAGGSDVYVLSVADGRRIALLPTGPVQALALSPSLVASATGSSVSLWNPLTREPVGRIDDEEPVAALAFSRDARRLAVGSVNGTIGVWTRDGRRLARFDALGPRVTALAFSPSGDRLAAGFGNGVVGAWSLPEGRRLYRRLEHRPGSAVLSVAFGAGGARLVSAGRDSTVRVSNVATGEVSYTLRGHAGIVSDAGFSPNGQWIVTAGPTVAGLWDLAGRQRLLFLRGHTGRVLAATFGKSGRSIATMGSDGTLRTYRCEVCGGIPELLRLAERRLAATGRKLTTAERRLYLDAD